MANETILSSRDIRDYPFLGETKVKPGPGASLEFMYNGIIFLCLPDAQFVYSPESNHLLLESGTFFWTNKSTGTEVTVTLLNQGNVMNPSGAGKIALHGNNLEVWNYSGELNYRFQNTRYHLKQLSYSSTVPAMRGAVVSIAPAPESIDPDNQNIFFDEKAIPVVHFHWKGVPGVSTYLFRIYPSLLKEDVLTIQQVDGNTITVNIMPYIGQRHFYWDVCAFDPARNLESVPSRTGFVQLSGTFFAQKATTKPPELTLYPFTISGNMVVIKGSATPGSQMFIDDNQVTLDSLGNFTYTIFYPSMGLKDIVFNVISSTGLTTTLKRQVIVSDISI